MIHLLVALSLLAPGDAEGAAEWLARYRVRFGHTETGVPKADVEASLRWMGRADARPTRVDLDMAEDGFPKGYGFFVHGSGPPPYRLPVQADGSASFEYTVVLEHDPAGWGPGPDEAPYRFERGAFWTGRALFITAPESRVELELSAPEGQRVSVSYAPVADRPGQFTVSDESRLRNSFVVVGDHAEVRLSAGRSVVILALGGKLEDSMPVLEKAIRRFLDASGKLFGGAPLRRVLVAGNLGAGKGSLHGGTFGDDVSFLADEPLGPGNSERWLPFLCHEIFHLWNGRTIDFSEQAYWFTEGFTEYYGGLLPVRLGEFGGDQLLRRVRKQLAAYLGDARPLSLLEAGEEKFLNTALVYDGGALAALCLDLRIRAATKNRKSLDDVMKVLYRRRLLTLADVRRAVSTIAGRPMDSFFDMHIQGREVLPLAESLQLAGLELRTEIAELPEAVAVTATLLQCPSVTRIDDGLELLSCEPGSLRAGDVLFEVAGAPVRTFDALRWSFRDVAPGSTIAVRVERDGKREELTLRLGGDPAQALPRSRSVSVKLEPAHDADPLQLRIRRSLFGG